MKRYILNLFLLVMLFSVSACSDDDLGPSIFDPSTEELTELDLWMQANFTKPYNIEVLSSRIWRRHSCPRPRIMRRGWPMY